MALLTLTNLTKKYGDHVVIDGYNFSVEPKSVTVLMGPSGCGKSTLLNVIGLLDTFDSGDYTLFGESAPKPFSMKSSKLLRDKIGYLFQNFALVDHKSVKYNLMIALEHDQKNKDQRIKDALEKVGLAGFEHKKVFECSGGEQQRIAIARILIKSCELVLCDEPTGSLDGANKQTVLDLLQLLQREGKTLIIVSHDDDIKSIADHVIYMEKLVDHA